MRKFSFWTSCFFIFFLLTSPHHEMFSSTNALSLDIINKTCKKCSDESIAFSYNFCSTSLEEIPVSHATDLRGLAIIAMELALENTTNTVSTIKSMLSNGNYSSVSSACLGDCFELYSDAVSTLVDAIEAFLIGNYGIANVRLSAVMTATSTCDEGFREMKEVSPLAKHNYSLFQLCDIPLCIINLLSLAVKYS
ncbi:putative Plant invertase/pectin methylesterase inhibitor superfamily protein [Tripterygium wilfordii]|uniref:Putative Plant invertase/pectin methylesterase inhibitor superfamily protein n=1 Tax=Tripterygium wilfordii TaxID=458696 RepID=A0A7J7C6C2_TRIWF|nr:putative invertase inhibitor [Tripterygium wilfordii]KAF5729671.1 putative Plant invertase/pectin methylesterase inhibitor superfamily protein [Tripterygium wilfordii]